MRVNRGRRKMYDRSLAGLKEGRVGAIKEAVFWSFRRSPPGILYRTMKVLYVSTRDHTPHHAMSSEG